MRVYEVSGDVYSCEISHSKWEEIKQTAIEFEDYFPEEADSGKLKIHLDAVKEDHQPLAISITHTGKIGLFKSTPDGDIPLIKGERIDKQFNRGKDYFLQGNAFVFTDEDEKLQEVLVDEDYQAWKNDRSR